MKLDFTFKDLFHLKKLLTPSVLPYLYWLSCAGVVLFALISIIASFTLLSYLGFIAWISSFFMIVIYTIVLFISVRVGFELIIVFFNINDNLKKIAAQGSNTDISEKNQE